jgi:hypothetical protein
LIVQPRLVNGKGVEYNGKVIMDSQDLRKDLAIILSEPFRKLRA